MKEEKKNSLSVDIHKLERFWNVDLHAFAPGGTYPVAKLMDALGFFHVHGRQKIKQRGKNND